MELHTVGVLQVKGLRPEARAPQKQWDCVNPPNPPRAGAAGKHLAMSREEWVHSWLGFMGRPCPLHALRVLSLLPQVSSKRLASPGTQRRGVRPTGELSPASSPGLPRTLSVLSRF